MGLLFDLAYLVAAVPGVPILVRKSRRTGKYRSGLDSRLGFGSEILPPSNRRETGTRVLMLHCVSVGELNSATTLIQKLLAADEKLHIVVTTTTDTGTERAAKLYPERNRGGGGRVHAVRFPFDFSFAVERLLDRVGPDAIGLMELETWPNFLSIAQSRRIPVVLINGRLSEKSFPRYMLIRPVMAWMLRKIAWMGVQTPAIAGRMAALGAPRQRMEVIPTLKYDNAEVASHVAGQDELAAAMGLSVGHQLFVAGSTGPGEEEAVLAMVEALQGRYPALRVAIAPRHPEVVPQVIEAIRRRGLTPVLRSEWPDGKGRGQDAHATLGTSDVFVLNTMGELRKLYALSFVVFVGRSLFKKGGGGSDMIEVAALGKLCCFGPFTSNFAEVVELLVKEGTAVQLSEGREMADVVGKWLADPAEARAMGRRAQELIRRQQGSTERYVRQLMAVLGCSAGQ